MQTSATPLTATDPDNAAVSPSYALDGVDKASFQLGGAGNNQLQVRVWDDAELRDQGHVHRYGECEGWLRASE